MCSLNTNNVHRPCYSHIDTQHHHSNPILPINIIEYGLNSDEVSSMCNQHCLCALLVFKEHMNAVDKHYNTVNTNKTHKRCWSTMFSNQEGKHALRSLYPCRSRCAFRFITNKENFKTVN